MANDFPYVYPYSREEAKRLNQFDLWQDSHLPDWAIEKLSEMQEQESSAMGGMEMK